MAIVITPESEYGKELAKWNKPYRFEPYPKMLYRAQRTASGKWSVGDPMDESFTRSCQLIVRDEVEERRANDNGWRETQGEALAYQKSLDDEIARAAAEEAYRVSKMGKKAQAEAAAADAETMDHVAEVPEKRRPGRPRKVAVEPEA